MSEEDTKNNVIIYIKTENTSDECISEIQNDEYQSTQRNVDKFSEYNGSIPKEDTRACEEEPTLELKTEIRDSLQEDINREMHLPTDSIHTSDELIKRERNELSLRFPCEVSSRYNDSRAYFLNKNGLAFNHPSSSFQVNEAFLPPEVLKRSNDFGDNELVLLKQNGDSEGMKNTKQASESYHTNKLVKLIQTPIRGNLPESKLFICNYCNVDFNYKSHLKQHLIIHFRGKRFKCDECNLDFTRKGSLAQHKLIHAGMKQFVCVYCSKDFFRRTNLKEHLRIHSGEKPYKCDRCDKLFNHKISLKKHILDHDGDRPYKCSLCIKDFTDKSSLTKHSAVHSEARPHKCVYCDKGFKDKSVLRRHAFIHAKERRFKCSQCNKGFNDRSTLQKHLVIHSGERPFKCRMCSKDFTRRIYLKNHLRHHSGEIFST